jgi:hypothetical protein
MTHFITFGNKKFANSKKRIVEEASTLQIFTSLKSYGENDVQEFINVLSQRIIDARGFWWYTWKPYIIYKRLQEIKDGQVLVYCDSGMTIFNSSDTKNKMNKIISLVQNETLCPTGIATFITTGSPEERYEYMYNTKNVCNFYNIEYNNKDIINTQQVQAGICFVHKTSRSLEIIKSWYNTALTQPELFVGDMRFIKNKEYTVKHFDGFKDHRHDQSIWSILCKLHKVSILPHSDNPIFQSHKRC